jgi:choline transport protein
MDDKALGSVRDLELADLAQGASPVSDVEGVMSNMTRDEREMAFYGKKGQLQVRVLNGPAAAVSRN